jgi:hypothetical protein
MLLMPRIFCLKIPCYKKNLSLSVDVGCLNLARQKEANSNSNRF